MIAPLANLCLAVALPLVAVLFSFFTPGTIAAQEGPYENYLVGDRATGLAGAFVAVADDASTIFHNPGGLAALPSSSVSGSLWVVSFASRTVEDGYVTDLGNGTLDHSASPSIPLFVSAVFRFGPRDESGLRRHAIAATILNPHRVDTSFLTQLEGSTALGPSVARLQTSHSEVDRWYGTAYGYRLTPRLSLGVSAFLATREVNHSEIEVFTSARAIDPAAETTTTRNWRTSINTEDLIFRFGARLDIGDHWRAGALLQLPGIQIGGSATIDQIETGTSPPDRLAFSTAAERGIDADSILPWEARIGFAWVDDPLASISLDLSILGPLGGEEDPIEVVGTSNLNAGLLFPRQTRYRPTVRIAAGFNFTLFDRLPIRGGVRFDPSTAPDVLGTETTYVRDDIDRLGFALSVGYQTEDFDFAVGTTAIFGWGQGLALTRSFVDGSFGYQAADVNERTVYLFISGATSVIRRIVDEVTDTDTDEERATNR
ncbi:MAG: hypothetical protein AAGF12_20795 [Myxococcota bacterium]